MVVTNKNKSLSPARKRRLIASPFALLHSFWLGDVWWARSRVVFLMSMVILISIGLVDWLEQTTFMRIWNDIIFPLLMLNLFIYFSVLILRGFYETSMGSLKIFFYSLALVLSISVFIWLENKYIVVFLTGVPLIRYLIIPIAILFGALVAGVNYVQDVYNLESYGVAALYLIASFGGVGYPKLKISEGQKKIDPGKINRLEIIGGPGYITIHPGNVILTERLHSPAGVYSAGTFFASRFETIVDILNLDDQHGEVPSISATTKDGITVTVQEVQFRYRVWSGQRATTTAITTAGRNLSNPYPYTVQAVRNKAYSRSVGANGLTSWHDAVKNAITGAITGYISEHQLDQITAPRYIEGDPRKEISNQLQTPATRDKLKDVGAQLLWCDIGHFKVENEAIADQRIDTWKAGWIGNANVKRAYGEAQRIAYQDIGHAEAQAEILMNIIHAFDDLDLTREEKDRNLRNIILMRTAQVLESLASTTNIEQSSVKDIKKEGK